MRGVTSTSSMWGASWSILDPREPQFESGRAWERAVVPWVVEKGSEQAESGKPGSNRTLSWVNKSCDNWPGAVTPVLAMLSLYPADFQRPDARGEA